MSIQYPWYNLPVGPQGAQGATGPMGPTGSQGNQGAPGNTGAQGPLGFQGNPGPQGNQGTVGLQGPIGNTGPQGIPGETASAGATGPQGPQGFVGATGPQGFQGSTGNQGNLGPQGPQGIAGVGPQGAQGSTGPQGVPGPYGTAGGDLAGTYPNPSVFGLGGIPINFANNSVGSIFSRISSSQFGFIPAPTVINQANVWTANGWQAQPIVNSVQAGTGIAVSNPTGQGIVISATGGGSPAGGTTGQALVKNSNTDFDTKWSGEVEIHTGNTAPPAPHPPFTIWIDTSTTSSGGLPTPTNVGQFPIWTGSNWGLSSWPGALPGQFPFWSNSNNTYELSEAPNADGQIPIWVAAQNMWIPDGLSGDVLGPANKTEVVGLHDFGAGSPRSVNGNPRIVGNILAWNPDADQGNAFSWNAYSLPSLLNQQNLLGGGYTFWALPADVTLPNGSTDTIYSSPPMVSGGIYLVGFTVSLEVTTPGTSNIYAWLQTSSGFPCAAHGTFTGVANQCLTLSTTAIWIGDGSGATFNVSAFIAGVLAKSSTPNGAGHATTMFFMRVG